MKPHHQSRDGRFACPPGTIWIVEDWPRLILVFVATVLVVLAFLFGVTFWAY